MTLHPREGKEITVNKATRMDLEGQKDERTPSSFNVKKERELIRYI